MKNKFLGLVMFWLATLTIFSAAAGNLDQAPFKISIPGDDWQLDDTTTKDMGQNVSLVAILAKTNSTLKSVVVKTIMDTTSATAFTDLLAGMRDSLANPMVKNITEADVIYLGIKGRHFTYETTQNGQTTYSDTIVFVSGNIIWTIGCVGLDSQKAEVRKMLTYYQKRDH